MATSQRLRAERLRLIGIADGETFPWSELELRAHEASTAGLPALMVRDRATTDRNLFPIAWRLREAARRAGALFILNRHFSLVPMLSPDALHIGAGDPAPDDLRGHLGTDLAIGYSAHSEEEALTAFRRGADYVMLSPIYRTASKPGAVPLGLERLGAFCRRAPGPVVALGGIDVSNLPAVLSAGAAGAAMIRGIFTGDPACNLETLRRALHPSA